MPKKNYSKEEKAEYKAKKQAEIKQTIAKIENGVRDVFTSDKYREYLKFCSQFTNYSVNNTILIQMQRPDALLVAGFQKWKQFDRSVNKGEKGIEILVPIKSKTNHYVETEVPDVDEYGNKQYNPDGTEKTKTVATPMTELRFTRGYVFDVSQTSGKELPTLAEELKGSIDKDKMRAIVEGVKNSVGIPVTFENIQSGSKGYFSVTENKIAIKSGMSDIQTLKTLFHEAAHAKLHGDNSELRKTERSGKEIQAESTAYIIANHYGIDTSEYSFPYIAAWSDGKELKALKSHLDEIQKAAKEICDGIDKELAKLKSRNLSFEELSASKELTNVQKAEILVERREKHGVIFSSTEKNEIYDTASKSDDIKTVAKKIKEIENKQQEINSYGNDFTDIMPIDSRQQAYESYDNGQQVYMAYPDNTVEPVEERYEIEAHDGYYGVPDEPLPPPDYPDYYMNVPPPDYPEMGMSEPVPDYPYEPYTNPPPPDYPEMNMSEPVPDYPYEPYTNPPPPDYPEMSMNEPVPDYPYEPYTNPPQPKTEEVKPEKPETTETKNFRVNNSIAEKVKEQLNADGVAFSAKVNAKTNTITVNISDVDAYKTAVTKVKTAELEREKAESLSAEHHIGNTEKENIGDTKEFKVSSHATNIIANQLKNDGISFNAEKRDIYTVFTIAKSDEQAFRESTQRALSGVKKMSPEKNDYSDIPLYQESFNHAKSNNQLTQFYDSLNAVKACDKFISENIENELMNRNDKGFADEIEKRFGLEKAMYVLSKALSDKGSPVNGDNFSYNVKSFKPMQNVTVKMAMAIYNELSQRSIARNQEQETPSLPAYFNGKHLYSAEKTVLSTDNRGLPATENISSYINETYVKGYGWLDREQFEKAKRESENPKKFNGLIEKYNISYVTDNGRVAKADITKAELATFRERTYSPENKEKLESAISKIDNGKSEKPELFYAISHLRGEKYQIVTLGVDGTKDVVQGNLSKQQAIDKMNQIFVEKQDTANVQIISPEELDKISVDIFQHQTEEERKPDKLFKVLENPNKQAAEKLSHYVQELKLVGEDYVAVGVAKVGTYDECSKAAEKLMKDNNPTYRIYQVKEGDEGRYIRFENIASLTKR